MEPSSGAKRSPSFQPLWVPRKWKPAKGAEEELELKLELELELLLELELELELEESTELELEESTELELLETALELLKTLLELLEALLELLTEFTEATDDEDGGSSGLVELAWLLEVALLGTGGALAAEELLATWLELRVDASDSALDEDGLDDDFDEDDAREGPDALEALLPPPPQALNTKLSDRTESVLKVYKERFSMIVLLGLC